MYYTSFTYVIQVHNLHMHYTCKTNHICNTDVHPTHLLDYKYTGVIHVADTCVKHMFYICNAHKTPHMYFRPCSVYY